MFILLTSFFNYFIHAFICSSFHLLCWFNFHTLLAPHSNNTLWAGAQKQSWAQAHTHTHTYLFASSLSTCHIPCDLTTYFFRYLCLLFHLREIITLYYNNALGKKERRKKKKKKSSNHAKSVLPVKWLLWAHFHWPGLSAIRKKSLGKLKGQRTIP